MARLIVSATSHRLQNRVDSTPALTYSRFQPGETADSQKSSSSSCATNSYPVNSPDDGRHAQFPEGARRRRASYLYRRSRVKEPAGRKIVVAISGRGGGGCIRGVTCVACASAGLGRCTRMHKGLKPRSMSETGHLPTDVESSERDPEAATLRPAPRLPFSPRPPSVSLSPLSSPPLAAAATFFSSSYSPSRPTLLSSFLLGRPIPARGTFVRLTRTTCLCRWTSSGSTRFFFERKIRRAR